MPTPASAALQDIFRQTEEIRASVDGVYSGVRSKRRGYWTPRRIAVQEKKLKAQFDKLTSASRKFYEGELEGVFVEGARSIDANYQITEDDRRLLSTLSDQSMTKINTSNELAKRGTFRWGEISEGSSFKGGANKYNVRGMVTADGRRYRPDQYAKVVLSADASRVRNFGIVRAAVAQGARALQVNDGADCGWTDHDDPQTANGMIVTFDQALSHPIAHPYCQRTFSPTNLAPPKGDKVKRVAVKAAKVAAAGSVAAVAGTVALRSSKTLQARLTAILAASNPQFMEYRSRVLQVAAATRREFDEIAADLRREMDDWIADADYELSQRARQLIGVGADAPLKVVGDAYSDLYDFDRLRFMSQQDLDLHNSIGGHVVDQLVGSGGSVSWSLPKVFRGNRSIGTTITSNQGRFSSRVGRDLRTSVSHKLGDHARVGAVKSGLDEAVVRYVNFTPNRMIRYRLSSVKTGVANRVVMNPSGMVRAGFAVDPRTGFVRPSLRFLPKGPIRITSEVNRSRGTWQNGRPLERPIGSIINVTRTRVKNRVYEETRDIKDIMSRGQSGQPGFLYESDFASGGVLNQLVIVGSDTGRGNIIRRGVIKNALSITDSATNKNVRVDLHIVNGKFVTRHRTNAGRINSVSTNVEVRVVKGIRFNLNTGLNLRGLDIDNLADLRHIRLHDIKALDLRNSLMVRSLSLNLHAFGHSIWEISKILRMSWEDVRLLWADTKRLADAAWRHQIWGQVRSQIELETGITEWTADGIRRELADRVREIPGLMQKQAAALKKEWVDDPISWVAGSADRMAKISKAVQVRYNKPRVSNVVKLDYEGLERNDGPFLTSFDRGVVEDLSDIIYMQPSEIAEDIGITLREAEEMHRRALIVLRDKLGLDKDQVLPDSWGTLAQSRPLVHDVSSVLDDQHFARMTSAADAVNNLEPGTTIAAVSHDIRIVANYLEREFPELPPIRFRLVDDPDNDLGASAQYLSADMIRPGIQRLVVDGKLGPDAIESYMETGEIWIHQSSLQTWMYKYNVSGATPWTMMQVDGMNQGLSIMLHEMGHHAHIALDSVSARFRKTVMDDIWDKITEIYPVSLDDIRDSGFDTDNYRELYEGLFQVDAVRGAIPSQYAFTNHWEFFAELFNYGAQYPGKSKLADGVYQILKEAWS